MSNLIACAMQATGKNVNASLLLLRIMHWSKYARITFGGNVWIVKSGAEWCAETQFNIQQYHRAIAHLRKHDLVITESHLFKNKSCTFARLTDKMKGLISIEMTTPDDAGNDLLDLSNTALPYSTKDTTKDTTKELALPMEEPLAPPSSEPAQPEKKKEEFTGKVKKEKIEVPPKEVDVGHSMLDVIQGKLNPKLKSKKPPTDTAEAIKEWLERTGEVTGKFQAPFTAKMSGQMKMFVSGVPKGMKAPAIIRDVLKDWDTFADEVKELKGWTNAPSEPDFGWFFLNRSVAYNFKPATGQPVKILKSGGDPDNHGIKMYKVVKK